MGKFSKFGSAPALTDGRSASSSALDDERRRIARATSATVAAGGPAGFAKPARVAIALDATGSMAGLLENAKRAIEDIVRRATVETKRPLEIELFVYRDYDVPRVVARSGATGDHNKLIAWLGTANAEGGGGNSGEAVEAALALIAKDRFACVLIAGDEPSNSRANLHAAGRAQDATAHDLARTLGDKGVPVHSFVIGNDSSTAADFAQLSGLSGGKSGRLDGSREMVDLAVMAILSSLGGTGAVARYADTIALTENTRAFATALLGAPK